MDIEQAVIELGQYLDEHCLELGGIGSLEELDGFLFGIVTAPDPLLPSQWLATVWGADHAFADPELAVRLLKTLELLHQMVIHRVADWNDGAFRLLIDGVEAAADGSPVFGADPDGAPPPELTGMAWAIGFLRAFELDEDRWEAFAEEWPIADEVLNLCVELGPAPADESTASDSDPDAPPESQLAPEGRLLALEQLSIALHELYALHQQRAANRQTVRRDTPKVGRNDPCPCGSGRKYKQCCGAN
jgi:uncharacterized protein